MPYRNLDNKKRWTTERRKLYDSALIELKSKPCTDCGGSFPPYVMEFDHVPERGPKKARIVSLIRSRSLNAPTLRSELAKCDVVCANCHRIRTFNRRQHIGPVGSGTAS